MNKLSKLVDAFSELCIASLSSFLFSTWQLMLNIRHSAEFAVCFGLVSISCYFTREWVFSIPLSYDGLTTQATHVLMLGALFSLSLNLFAVMLRAESYRTQGRSVSVSFIRVIRISLWPIFGLFVAYAVFLLLSVIVAVSAFLMLDVDETAPVAVLRHGSEHLLSVIIDVYVFGAVFASITHFTVKRNIKPSQYFVGSSPGLLWSVMFGTIAYLLQGFGVEPAKSVAVFSAFHCLLFLIDKMGLIRGTDGKLILPKTLMIRRS
ncbi:hypothetical protein ACHELQ_001981 [Vibrio fluvialis]